MAAAANNMAIQRKLPHIQRLFRYISVFLGESVQGIN